MEYLVIRLPALEANACWQVVDSHGAPLPQCGEGELAQAAAVAEGKKVMLLVPAGEVFRASLELPVRGRRAAVKGARYALEDRIAGDVEEMHFAFGPATGDSLDVAAIERRRLAEWLSRCSSEGLTPVAVYGEGDTLPELPNATIAMLEQDKLLVRNGGGQVASAEPGELASLVDILCAELADEEASPFRLVIYCEPALESAARKAVAQLAGREVDLRLLESGVMAHMAAEALSGRGVNLLQGEFRPRDDQYRSYRNLWVSLLAVALLYPVFLALDGWRAQKDYEAVAEAVDAGLGSLMPGVTGRANLRAELRRRIVTADLAAAANSDEFLRLVEALENSGGERVRVLGLHFGNGPARVQVRATDMETLDETRRRLVSSGYSVLVQTAVPESNGAVVGELDLRDEQAR